MSPNWGYKPTYNLFWPVIKYPEAIQSVFFLPSGRSILILPFKIQQDRSDYFRSVFNLGHWNRSGYTIWHCEAYTVKNRVVRVGCGNDFIQKPMIFGAAAVTLFPAVPKFLWQASPDSSRFGRSFFFGARLVPKCPCNGKEEGREYGKPTAGPGSHDISELPSKKKTSIKGIWSSKTRRASSRGGNMWSGTQISSPMGFVTLFRGKCGCKMT